MNALIIVDIQNDFLPKGALPVPDGDSVIPVINRIQDCFDLVVATQDWHPAGHLSFASSHPGRKEFEIITLEGLKQVLWPDHCVQGTPGAEFSSLLDTKKIEAIFRKGMDPHMDSYSGFFDNGKKKATGLGDYLKGRGVNSVMVAGLAGDYCVNFTATDALELGLNSTIITDATSPIDAVHYQEALRDFSSRNGKLIPSSEILQKFHW